MLLKDIKHLIWFFSVAAGYMCFSATSLASDLCVTVTDPAGGTLGEAWVNVVDLSSQRLYNSHADQKGGACFSVPEGLYSVEAGRLGFLNVMYYPVTVDFPSGKRLAIPLPFGKIREGGIRKDSVVSGILREGNAPVDGATICLTLSGSAAPRCTLTNDLGEYAFILPLGTYQVEVRVRGKEPQHSRIDIDEPSWYHNIVAYRSDDKAKH